MTKRRPKREKPQAGSRPSGEEYQSFQITSGYGGNTDRPFVEIRGPARATISPQEARNLAHAAEAADTDAFIVEYFRDQVGLDMQSVAGLLVQFREWRFALWREKYGIDVDEIPDSPPPAGGTEGG